MPIIFLSVQYCITVLILDDLLFFWEQTPHKRKKIKIIPKNTFFDKSVFTYEAK